MSLCINPTCPQPNHPGNQTQQVCQECGSNLILQGRYRVMRLLSDHSGFGYVYEVFESNVPKILKVLKEIHNDNLKAVELFEQEARVLGQLQHPGIPAIDEPGCFQFRPSSSSPPLHCIVMEKIDGPNLREWMQQQGNYPINATLALDWLTQLVGILHLVHSQNYFHRDIKPENIMLRPSGELVLVDFGAAREMTGTYFARLEKVEGVTRVSSTGYTPPEQERGRAVPQSDFYALGCTFMFLLTGQRPMGPEIYDAMQNQFHWRQYAPTIPAALANLIDQLTAARAADRPPNTSSLLQQLDHIRAALPAAPVAQNQVSADDVTAPPAPAAFQTVFQGDGTVLQHSEIDTAAVPRPLLSGQSLSKQPFVKHLFGKFPLSKHPLIWMFALGVLAAAVGGTVYQWRSPLFANRTDVESPRPDASAFTTSTFATFTGHSAAVNALELSLDETMLASGSDDRTVKLWDLRAGEELRSLSGHNDRVQAVTFNPDGKLVISGSGSGEILVRDTATGILSANLTGHDSAINDLAVSSDGRILASASADRTIRLWDLQQGELLQVLEGHQSYVNTIVFAPDGKTLMSGSADRTIRAWTLESGESVVLEGHDTYINDIAISPDGSLLLSAGADNDIVLWDLATQVPQGRLTGHKGYVNDLRVSPNGQWLVSSDADSSLKVWSLPERQLQHTISWRGTLIDAIAVRFGSLHWQILAGGKGSTSIKGWTVEPGE